MISVRIITNLFFKKLTNKDSLQRVDLPTGVDKTKATYFFEDLALCKRRLPGGCLILSARLWLWAFFEKRLKENTLSVLTA